MRKARGTRPPCPRCGSTDVLPIAYGMPAPDLFEASERGEVELGGCCVDDGLPEWRCRACGCGFDRTGPCAEPSW